MKYKLLKNTPTIKAGTIGEPVDCYYKFDMNSIGLNGVKYEFIRCDAVESQPDWFEPVIERWRAVRDGGYYFFEMAGDVVLTQDGYVISDANLFEFGNYFKTREQAEEASRRIKKVLMDYHAEIGE